MNKLRKRKRFLSLTGLGVILFASCFLFLAFSTTAFAEKHEKTPTEYRLLAPIPLDGANNAVSPTSNASTYLKGLFMLTIGIATALAVIFIIVGGIQYLTSEVFTAKAAAKDTITNALVGLLMAISAWMILYTINPKLLNFDLKIEPVKINVEPASNIEDFLPTGPSAGKPWANDQAERASVERVTSAGRILIGINKNNCAKIGDSNCTSVSGLSSSIINSIKSLQSQCNCLITITGGTEYWLHGNRSTELTSNKTQHRPGGSSADLSFYTPITDYIRKEGDKTDTPGCAPGNEKYVLNGATYVLETIGDTHWHVCH
ncbi:MAG: pilin [Candidatus Zambryskibacteria bacterium]|nr:pilin [Candidatus Zambryskibacteria bacterium]